jgi:hypothetical protein
MGQKTGAYLLKCAETGQNRSTDPGGVLAFWGCINFDLDVFQSQFLHFGEETIAKAFEKKKKNPRQWWGEKNSFHFLPRQRVLPPLSTMFENRFFRRSRSTRLIESTTTWCTPGYSCPIISGLNKISGARNRSEPSWFEFASDDAE